LTKDFQCNKLMLSIKLMNCEMYLSKLTINK